MNTDTWTEEEIALLRKLWRTDLTAAEVATQIGRSRKATSVRAAALGLPGRRAARGRAYPETTREEMAILKRIKATLRAEALTDVELERAFSDEGLDRPRLRELIRRARLSFSMAQQAKARRERAAARKANLPSIDNPRPIEDGPYDGLYWVGEGHVADARSVLLMRAALGEGREEGDDKRSGEA